MTGKNVFIVFTLSLIILSSNLLHANDDTLSSSISSTKVPLGETFVFTITINNGSARISPPDIENAKYLTASQKQSIVYANGEKKSSAIYAYTYRAEKLGHSVIHPIEVTINRKQYYTEFITFEIVENTNPSSNNNSSSNSSNNSNNSNNSSSRSRSRSRSAFDVFDVEIENMEEEIFIRSQLSKTNVYMYEPLYFEQNVYVSDAVYAEVAKFDKAGEKNDFLVKRDTNKYNSRNETIEGKRYAKHVLSKEVLFAIFSGERTISENSYTLDVSSKFLGLNDKIRLGGKSHTVNVLPLPTVGKPSGFSGGVGQFDFNISIDKDNVSKDESFILKVVANGMGYADTVVLPNIQKLLDDKYGNTLYVYPPKQFTTNDVRDGKIYGEKVDEYMVVVKDDSSAYLGKIELEPIEFSYFSPEQESYITLKSQKIELAVVGENNPQNNSDTDSSSNTDNGYENNYDENRRLVAMVGSEEDSSSSLMLLPIKEGDVKIENDYIFLKKGFMYLYLAISIFIIAATFLAKKFVVAQFMNRNKKAKNSLASFDSPIRYLQNGDMKTCIKEIERTFYENLSVKLKQKVSNNVEMSEVFKANNIDSKLLDKASSAVETCHYLLYSPIAHANIDKNFMEQKHQVEDIIRAMKSVINTL